MPIDKWFPLAIDYADLPNAKKQNVELKQAILQLMDASDVRVLGQNRN